MTPRIIAARMAGVIAVFAFVSPAEADRRDRQENQYRACINDYGRHHRDRCLEIAYPQLSEDRAIMDYYLRDDRNEVWHRGECWSNPRLSSRASCLADGREDDR
jgi:hypothetical protein